MSTRVDPLEQSEPLSKPLMISVTCHVALFASTMVWSLFYTPISLGDPTGDAGGAVVVNPVNGIPLPRSRTQIENPVANPVEHNVPSIPEPRAEAAPPEPEPVPEAETVPIEKERKRRKAQAANQQKYQAPVKENQVASSDRRRRQLSSLHREPAGERRWRRRLRKRQPVRRPLRLVCRRAATPSGR